MMVMMMIIIIIIDDLSRAIERVTLLQVHDALVILKNSLAIPKLLYLLRTSDCGDNPLLSEFDNTLRSGLTSILNVDLSENQWIQASLPVGDGSLGIRSAQMLAPSAFLASAASTFQLQQSILPDSISSLEDGSLESIKALWAGQSNSAKPAADVQHITYRRPEIDRLLQTIEHSFWQEPLVMWTTRLLAASSHSGDWLHAPPITAVGLRLSVEAIRMAVAH